ncbi:uncharacterized protein LOC113562125 [Ooceraea biroi]|uniref:uncharacterized protein LOC113562125 n=1 Tax=Ooceraea biroi TaxID=2015173 RepID=UPI000F09568E|nr:uncharacterized protein LOC113562125 [Ooceraea biroi]
MARSQAEDFANIEKLSDSENYQVWKFQISILFRANELYGTVTEEVAEGQRTDQWRKKDANAQKIIVTTIERKPLLHIMSCTTSHEMWTKISNIYERDTEQQKCSLLQMFYSATYDKTTDIVTYISGLKNLVFRLNALDTKIDDKMLISKILASLPEEYKYFASAWDSTEQGGKTVENLTARLIAEEMRNNQKESESKTVTLKTAAKKCTKCNKTGHLAKFCHIAKHCEETNKEKCSICSKTNHSEKDCFFRDKKKNKNESFLTGKLDAAHSWIVDSGSTQNLTNNKSYVQDIKKTIIGV